ncbi:MAG: hypothetical protein ACXVKN_12075, partial [Acidimicrobiia bacterium]
AWRYRIKPTRAIHPMRRFSRRSDRSSCAAAITLSGTRVVPTRVRRTSDCAMAPWSGPGFGPVVIRRRS